MSTRRRPAWRRETFEEFCARRLDDDQEDTGCEAPTPDRWQGKRRCRARREPPDFEAEEEHAKAYAEIHCRLHQSEVVSRKRLDGGRTAALLRD